MPYVYDFEQMGADEGERLPKPDEFQYLPPPAIGGPSGPVTFRMPPLTKGRTAGAPTSPRGSGPGLLARILGRAPAASPRPTDIEGPLKQLLPELVNLGVTRAYCRYDGGNDEGFAWLDHVVTAGGETIGCDTLVAQLAQTPVAASILAEDQAGKHAHPETTAEELVRYAIRDELAIFGAAILLGEGYGTGPLVLYGAFTMDFTTGQIIDDANAEAIVENIGIDGGAG